MDIIFIFFSNLAYYRTGICINSISKMNDTMKILEMRVFVLAFFCLVSISNYSQIADSSTYLSGVKSIMNTEWPKNRTVNIVFHALGQVALQKNLSPKISPAQVRCALTAVIKRSMEAPRTFDKDGWLKVGVVGSQPSMAEDYINTGSTYLCTTGFLPLGLPSDDPFWTDPDADWTSVKIWKGEDVKADHRL